MTTKTENFRRAVFFHTYLVPSGGHLNLYPGDQVILVKHDHDQQHTVTIMCEDNKNRI